MADVPVSIHPVTPDDNDAKFDPRGVANAVWSDYYIVSRYEKDYQRYMLGTTSDQSISTSGRTMVPKANTVAVVQLARPTLLWVVDWTVARAKEKPLVPEPEQFSTSRWILLGEKIEPGMIVLGPDGVTPVFRVSGTYVYAQLAPNTRINRDVVFPIPPWIQKGAYDRSMPDNLFERDLINNKAAQ